MKANTCTIYTAIETQRPSNATDIHLVYDHDDQTCCACNDCFRGVSNDVLS